MDRVLKTAPGALPPESAWFHGKQRSGETEFMTGNGGNPLYEGKSPGAIAAKRLENQKRLGIVPPSAKLGMRNKFNPAGYEKNWEPIHLSSRGSQ